MILIPHEGSLAVISLPGRRHVRHVPHMPAVLRKLQVFVQVLVVLVCPCEERFVLVVGSEETCFEVELHGRIRPGLSPSRPIPVNQERISHVYNK